MTYQSEHAFHTVCVNSSSITRGGSSQSGRALPRRRRRIGGLVLAFVCLWQVGCFSTAPAPSETAPASSVAVPAPAAATLDIIEYADRYGLYAVGPEWEAARDDALRAGAAASTWEDVAPVLEAAVSLAGGHHSRVSWGDEQQPMLLGQPSMFDRGDVVVLTLPTVWGASIEDRESYAVKVAEFIESRRTSACGWVVDLRNNGGGGTYPLIAGLGALLPDEVLYANRDRHGGDSTWVLQGNELLEGTPATVPVPPYGEPA